VGIDVGIEEGKWWWESAWEIGVGNGRGNRHGFAMGGKPALRRVRAMRNSSPQRSKGSSGRE
jgi:hypothetical protein